LVALKLIVGCGTSSSHDAGAGSANDAGDVNTGGGPVVCVEPTQCAESQACCAPVASFLSGDHRGTCVAGASSCTGISRQCSKAADCEAGGACCVGKFGLGGVDLSALDADASDVIHALSATCQIRCMPGQPQLCGSDTECPAGSKCQSTTAGGPEGGVQVDLMECSAGAGNRSSEADASGDAQGTD
jgi:hypothetical protein